MSANIDTLKREIKQWELSFAEKNHRKPSKVDIKGSSIEGIYLEYWKIKNSSVKQDVQKSNDNVWSNKFNKSSSSSKVSCVSGSPKFQSSISQKLWKSSLEAAKFTPSFSFKKAVKTPAYSYPVQPEPEVKSESKISDSIQESTDSTCLNWTPPSSTPKFSLNRCNKVHLSSSQGLRNEVDVEWLDKCMSSSFSQEESGDAGGNLNNDDLFNHQNSTTISADVLNSVDLNTATESGENHKGPQNECMLSDASRNNNQQETKSIISDENAYNETKLDSGKELTNREQLSSQEQVTNSKNQIQTSKIQYCSPEKECENEKLKPALKNQSQNVSPKEEKQLLIEEVPRKPNPASRKRKIIVDKDEDEPEDQAVKPKSKRLKGETGSRLVSENFVKVNIKRKKFTRGPHRLKSRQLKRMAWKKKKWASSSGKCFSCGKPGHWATNCPQKDEKLMNEGALEEAKKESNEEEGRKIDSPEDLSGTPQQIPKLPVPTFEDDYISAQLPVYLKKFKHKKFRPFQEEAIRSILSGKSALLVLPTGSGKSLCYQIPACIYSDNSHCISLVISPLVSLMEDQIKNHPSFLGSVSLHSGLTQAQRQVNMEKLKSGTAKVLLVAPESLLAMHAYFRSVLPPIAFVCIDEAHCLSEWSHNFRPSYLQVLKILRDSLNVTCMLGLSATVTRGTTNRICCLLNIDPDETVFGETFIPSNLLLSISKEEYKEEALLELLQTERYQNLKSVIIYCTRRETTERLATTIRIHFQNKRHSHNTTEENATKKKGKVGEDFVSAYHAGLTPAQRRTTQKNFMKGKLSMVVATVAFGMGLNKSDVRSVIHYDLPKSFESYVQEIGRAGRDGLPAYCHLFLHPQGSDLWELRRHIYANGVDRFATRKLLNRVFKPGAQLCDSAVSKDTAVREIAISVENIVQELDLNKEIIETLLCYLELHPGKWFEILPVINDSCSVKCYGGPQQLEKTIQKCKAVSATLQLSSTEKTTSSVSFSLVEICSSMGWNCELVRKELRNLQFASVNGSWHRTGVTVEFTNPSFHIRMLKELNSDEKDKLLNFVHEISMHLQKKELRKLESLFKTFTRYSKTHFEADKKDDEVSDGLKDVLCDYFRDGHVDIKEDVPTQAYSENELRKDICSFLDIYHEENFNAWQISRIFYGIGSPQFPAEVWGKVRRFWRSYIHVDFIDILALAREEILRLRS